MSYDYTNFDGLNYSSMSHVVVGESREADSSMSHVSAAAERREADAKSVFAKLRNTTMLASPKTKTTYDLLTPSCHLTSHTWSTFRDHVRTFPGWSAKRVAASDAEKAEHKETRKGKVYFVKVVFAPPSLGDATNKKKRRPCAHCGGTDHMMVTSKKCSKYTHMVVVKEDAPARVACPAPLPF